MRIKSSFDGFRLFWYQRVKGEELRSSERIPLVAVRVVIPSDVALGVEAHEDPD